MSWLSLVKELPHDKWWRLLWNVSWVFTFLFCDSHSCHSSSDSWHIKSGQTTWASVQLFITPPFQSILEIAARLIPETLSPYQALAQNIPWLLYWLQDEVQIPRSNIQSLPQFGSSWSFQPYLLSIPSSAELVSSQSPKLSYLCSDWSLI